jgi:type IV pilus assembly protein PilO
MAKPSEMPDGIKSLLIVGLVIVLTAAMYFLVYKGTVDQNRINKAGLQAKLAENEQLRPYEKNLPDLNRQIEMLKQQLEIQRKIVPDDKEVDEFMHMLQNTASSSGIQIRRLTAQPVVTREFYSEVPLAMEVDGPYYSMLTFFDRVSKLERIINMNNLQLGAIREVGSSKTNIRLKGNYEFGPNESVMATCVTTTFFSHDAKPVAPPPAQKKK